MSALRPELDFPSLLPSVLIGDPGADGRLRRSKRDVLVDLHGIAVALVGGLAIFLEANNDRAVAGSFWLNTADIVLGGAVCLGLWWRRRWPVQIVLLATALATFSSFATMASVVALFTVAVHRRLAVVAAVATLGLLTVPVYDAIRPSAGSVIGQLVLAVLITVSVVAWGMFVRARRQLVLSLRDRAERAEAEQALRVDQAQRGERARIAREMHDVLAHRISLVSLHAGALEFSPDAPPQEIARAAGVIRDSAHQALQDLREVIGVLREGEGAEDVPPERPQPTLADLDALLDESREAGVSVVSEVTLDDVAAVPVSTARTAFRIVQEGLTNARKHAPGCAVRVAVSGAPGDGLTVDVRNPLPVEAVRARAIPGAGLGIVGLAERVGLAGGRIEHGVTGGEFLLRVWLPWPAP